MVYFRDQKREYFNAYLFVNKDVTVLKDCSAGSNATTILAMDDQQTFYRKYAFGPDARKLHEQVLWLKTYQDKLPLCKIIAEKYTGDTCCYDMSYENNTEGFFQYIHESSGESSWNILKSVLEQLEEGLYTKSPNTSNDDDIPYTGVSGDGFIKIILGVIFIALVIYIKIRKMDELK